MRTCFVGAESSATITQLTVEQFLDFSPKLRAVLICEGLVQFWDRDGVQVPAREALDELEHTWFDGAAAGPAPPSSEGSRLLRERRQHERHPRSFPFRIVGGDAVCDFGVTENISAGGMLVRTEEPLPVGSRFLLEIPQADFEAPVVVLRSEQAPGHELAHAVGIAFDVPPPSAKRAA